VRDALVDAQSRGFISQGQDLDSLMAHARGFAAPLAGATRIVDLGTGGGVPGLVVAAACPAASMVLLDARVSRTDWLRRVVGRLRWGDRVRVVDGRAEELAHQPAWRGSQDGVVARGFAPPVVTAEVAAGFLRVGGRLVVSEPPTPDPARWPDDALRSLGLRRCPSPDPAYALLEQVRPAPVEIPRAGVVRGHTS
jgi:16S rRNA (guanine527-N7)-methyltransferase